MRVLIVEDEPLLELVLEDTIVSAGHEVIGWATNRANALALGDARSPEIAFVDLRLWDGDTGLELTRRLSERGIAVVVTSAYTSDHAGELDHALRVIPKPYTAATIQAVLRHAAQKVETALTEAGPGERSFTTRSPFRPWRPHAGHSQARPEASWQELRIGPVW